MLLRRARRLFDHVSKILSMQNLNAHLAADYTNILHVHLLPVAEYCSEAAATTFEGIPRYCVQEYRQINTSDGAMIHQFLHICVKKLCDFAWP